MPPGPGAAPGPAQSVWQQRGPLPSCGAQRLISFLNRLPRQLGASDSAALSQVPPLSLPAGL